MKLPQIMNWSRLAITTAAGMILIGTAGCQTNVGGQTLPSAYYLRDDVQYYPAGPQDKIFNERRALEQYKAGQQEAPPEEQTPAAQPAAQPPGAGNPP
jgi:hypothetical protein